MKYPDRRRAAAGWIWCCCLAACLSAAAVAEEPISDFDRDHWSFRPLERPSPPPVEDTDWIRNPLDQFVLARLEAAGLQPLPLADRETLIRRLYFDLIGLPPEPDQVDRFLRDDSLDAYGALVDRLLASPHHGQRWAQHWLDLARFAETDGFEHDKLREQAWRYRDWVIDALNSDMPYNRFVQLQLAGDELRPDDEHARIATTFCLAGPDMPDINSQEERRHNLLNEMTGTVSEVLLGLQLQCAQCHDHKFDPISQADFYRLRAIFAPSVRVKANKSVSTLLPPNSPAAESFVMVRGDFRRPGEPVEPGFPRIANRWREQVDADADDGGGRRSALAKWITRDDHPLTTRVIANRLWQYHFGRGLAATSSDFGVMGELPSHPKLLDWLATELVRRGWSLKRMHRLIVTSATYRQASHASSPRWTDQQRSEADSRLRRNMAEDPRNRLLGRFPRRRLEGEIIRDAMLAAAELLDSEMGGPGVMPPLPEELRATLLKGQWKTTEDRSQHYRRGVYVFARRNLRYPIFESFDRPDANASCARRGQSTTATQSLLLMNSRLSFELADRLAQTSLARAGGDAAAAASMAFRRALGRAASNQERDQMRAFLDQYGGAENPIGESATDEANAAGRNEVAALTDLCLALLNSNEFVYVD